MPDGSHWIAEAEEILPRLIDLRRAIHMEPEIGLQNPMTSAKAKAALAGLPLEIREGPSTTGFVAILRGSGNGRTVLLRGDTDALPMHEDTGLPFASKIPGAMHACGHDMHTTMLVGAAHLLSAQKDRLPGTVVFMFQPGEEGYHGARYMIEDGLLDPKPDAAFALHIMPNAPSGSFGGRAGPMLASADKIKVTVHGRGGHASMPHDAQDPVPVACEIVTALQVFVTRQIPVFDPAVITIGQITAGSTDNVIPEKAELLGTIRTLSEKSRQAMHEGALRVARHIAEAHGMTCEAQVIPGFPVTVCDPQAVKLASQTARDLFGDQAWRTMPTPVMGAEDFAYVLQQVPGAMAFIGVSPHSGDPSRNYPLHNTKMTADEAAMAKGAAIHAAFAENFLNNGFEDAA